MCQNITSQDALHRVSLEHLFFHKGSKGIRKGVRKPHTQHIYEIICETNP